MMVGMQGCGGDWPLRLETEGYGWKGRPCVRDSRSHEPGGLPRSVWPDPGRRRRG